MSAYIVEGADPRSKLEVLGREARYDVCGYPSIFTAIDKRFNFIYPATGSRGGTARLFKVLQTNACEGNCFYCANRRDRHCPRLSFRPEEMARLFMEHYKRNLVDGIFLSSAIRNGPDTSQEEILKTLRIIRMRYQYQGYIHCKILPGVSPELVKEASKLSDRLSINLEAPGEKYLTNLSPTKDFHKDLISGLAELSRINRSLPLKAGITTQLMVGVSGESDQDILRFASWLYKDYKLWRVYYSGFSPIKDTPLENNLPCSPWREARLYQADFLLRRYRFNPRELPFGKEGDLPEDIDPKLAWAETHPERFPVEINKASFWELMRIPGIGRISAGRIIQARRISRIKDPDQLKKLGIALKRAQRFLTLNSKFFPQKKVTHKKEIEKQMFLWEEI